VLFKYWAGGGGSNSRSVKVTTYCCVVLRFITHGATPPGPYTHPEEKKKNIRERRNQRNRRNKGRRNKMIMKIRQQQRNMKTAQQDTSEQKQTQGVSSPFCISKLQWINNQQWQSKTQLYL